MKKSVITEFVARKSSLRITLRTSVVEILGKVPVTFANRRQSIPFDCNRHRKKFLRTWFSICHPGEIQGGIYNGMKSYVFLMIYLAMS